MQKRYLIKVFDTDGTFKSTVNPKTQISDIFFDSYINGGQGQLRLNIDLDYTDTIISESDLIKVYLNDENNVGGKLIYTGIVTQVNRILEQGNKSQEIIAFGLFTILSFILYKDGSNLEFNKTDEPANILKDIISIVNAEYNLFTASSNIDNWGTTVNIDFANIKCSDSFRNVRDLTEYYFYIDETGDVYFKANPGSATHNLTVGKDVERIKEDSTVEKLVNKYYLDSQVTQKIFEDTASQSTYGLKELYQNRSDIADTTTRDEAGDSYIAENKNPKKRTTVTVNSNYEFENIKPGDTIKIRNFGGTIDNLQVQKIQYSPDRSILFLEEYDSIQKEFVLANG